MNNCIYHFSKGKFAILSAILLLASQIVNAQEFSNASLKGCYSGHLSGSVLTNPQDPSFQLPTSTVIRFCADGNGIGESSTSTQNLAGLCIMSQSGLGTYNVLPEGIGTAEIEVTNDQVSAGCAQIQPPIVEGGRANFGFTFAIDGEGCIDIIGTSLLTDPDGSPVAIPIVTHGRACSQESGEAQSSE